jgi:hypothetical protein
MVGRCNGDQAEYMLSDSIGNAGEVDIKLDLHPGKYYLYVEIDWMDTPFDYVVTSYGVKEVEFQEIKQPDKAKCLLMFYEHSDHFVRVKRIRKKLVDPEDSPHIYVTSEYDMGYLVINYINESDDHTLDMTLTFNSLKNLYPFHPDNVALNQGFKFTVLPKSNFLFLLWQDLEYTCSYTTTFDYCIY